MTWTQENARQELRNCCKFLVSRSVIALVICGFSLPMLEGTEFFVAVDHPNASDSNTGLSLAQPFKTLSRAVADLSPGDTLFIEEGIYREPLLLRMDGTPSSPVVVQAYPGDIGKVIIRGSDVVKGWTNDGGNVWSVSWHPLPPIEYPDGWIDYGEYSRRREMVFIDGNPLEQVLSGAELVSGHFWMDDAAQRIRILFSGDPNARQVEISVRTEGLMARGRRYQVIRGLRVEHVSTDVFTAAMALGDHQLVEDCRAEHNNGTGIAASSETVIKRTSSNHNGRAGISLSGSNSLVESSETSHNSWRYGPRWDAAGIKVVGSMPSGNRIKQHTSKYNNGKGIWFDTSNVGNVVEASVIEGNLISGIAFEAAIGPNWAINNVIIGTVKANDGFSPDFDGAGISMLAASDTLIFNNTIADVEGAGVLIGGADRNDHQFQTKNTQVFNNIIVSPGVACIRMKVWGDAATEERIASHEFDNNLYFDADPTIRFKGSNELWTLEEFQEIRGEDLNSLYESPEFVRPSVADYSLMTSSPSIDAGRYLADTPEDITGRPRPQDIRHDIGAYECPLGGGCGVIQTMDFENW